MHSLSELEEQQGPYDAVVVAAGAAAATLPEVGQSQFLTCTSDICLLPVITLQQVHSLADLGHQQGPCDVVVVAAGDAAATLFKVDQWLTSSSVDMLMMSTGSIC